MLKVSEEVKVIVGFVLVLVNKNLYVYCRKVCLWNFSCYFYIFLLIIYISI